MQWDCYNHQNVCAALIGRSSLDMFSCMQYGLHIGWKSFVIEANSIFRNVVLSPENKEYCKLTQYYENRDVNDMIEGISLGVEKKFSTS